MHITAEGRLADAQGSRHANVYRIPTERCHACQGSEDPPSTPSEVNPQLEFRDDVNPKLEPPPPETPAPSTRNSAPSNPKLEETSNRPLARIGPPKEGSQERKILTDAPAAHVPDPTAAKGCTWNRHCGQPVCPHEVTFCAYHACCGRCAAAPPEQP